MAQLERPEVFREKDCVLLLEDGTEYWGWSFGSRKTGFGEVIFNTAMAGYQEVLTDPSYWQQLVVMTYPHQGNYGLNEQDDESLGGPKVSGFVVAERTPEPSNFTARESLERYLERNEVPAIWGVDTRSLTLKIRGGGALRGLILSVEEHKKLGSDPKSVFKKYPKFAATDLISEVSTRQPYWFSEKGSKLVVAMDFGVKKNLLRELARRDCRVLVVPAKTAAREILAHKPDGVFLSNGPGDPSLATYAVATVRDLLGKVPVFGVCMGHQILGLALGAKTYKMKFGHRGVNQPVWNNGAGAVEISSHNHGYAVDAATLPEGVRETHRNLNDGACEGLEASSLNAFSVQYHPESAPGPHDSDYLFEKFCSRL